MDGRPLRVLYSFPHPLGTPGINTTAWYQVEALHALGVDVTVYCTSVARPLPPGVRVVETMRVRGRRVPHRAVGVSNALAYHDWRTARAIAAAGAAFDVVHCWPSGCRRTIRSAARAGVVSFRELPNAHTADTFAASQEACDEIGVQLPAGMSHRYDRRRLAREEREFAEADVLLAPSDFVADSFRRHGTPEARLARHRYGYDPDRFSAAPVRPDRPFTALFIGRGEPPKGLHLALEAWTAAGIDGRFLIAGSILPAYRDRLSDPLGRPDVEVLGFVSDVAEVMRRADVLVFPTYTEGSALVTYEAMACGVVPLVSTAAGAPVTDGVNALVHQVGDLATLTEHIRRVAGTADEAARLRGGALEASRQLTWHDAGEALVACYRHGLAVRAR